MKEAILLLGSNLGNRYKKLNNAIDLIGNHAGKIIKTSSIYESEPWGFKAKKKFLNQTLIIKTEYRPEKLLNTMQELEKRLGKVSVNQKQGYASRVIDIDILFYENEIIETERLTIPHKMLHKRKFTLMPLYEIANDLVHPVFNKTIAQLLAECPDNSKVYKTKPPNKYF